MLSAKAALSGACRFGECMVSQNQGMVHQIC
jgi:hypothetical protein